MPIVSIIFLVITGALLFYSSLTFLSKKIIVPIRMSGSVKGASEAYAKRMALLIAFLSISSLIAAILGLFISEVYIPIIAFFVLFIALLIVGIKTIMKNVH